MSSTQNSAHLGEVDMQLRILEHSQEKRDWYRVEGRWEEGLLGEPGA